MKNKLLWILVFGAIFFGCSILSFAEVKDELQSGRNTMSITTKTRKGNLSEVQKIFDSSPSSANVQRVVYRRDETIKILIREYMVSTIILPENESIASVALGDSANFAWEPVGESTDTRLSNVIKISCVYAGADTNMIVFGTSGNIYNFYIRAEGISSKSHPIFATYVVDQNIKTTIPPKPQSLPQPVVALKPQPSQQAAAPSPDFLRSLPLIDPSKLDYGYKFIKGDDSLAPLRVFDDGYFTYFQYAETSNLDKVKVPVLYRVVDGFDVPANTRVVGGTIIIESTSNAFTIRSGDKYLCVVKIKK